MVRLISTKNSASQEDLSKHTEKLAGMVEQQSAMYPTLPDTLRIGMLLALIDINALVPVTASTMTLANKNLS